MKKIVLSIIFIVFVIYSCEEYEPAFNDFPPGASITVIAEPNEGYRFSHWEMNGVFFEGGEEITFNMPPYDVNLTAFFVIF